MFNLEQALAGWRQQLVGKGIKTPEVLDELECHLRDEIERQIRSGGDQEHAYEIAVARIGDATVLRNEFAKLKENQRWPRFLKACYVLFVPCMLLINVWTLLEYELSSLERIIGFCALSLICSYLACLPYLLKTLAGAAYVRFATVIKIAIFFLWLWPVWALLEAENIVRSGMGIVPSMVFWCLYAAVAMTAFAFGLNESRRRPGGSGGPLPPSKPDPEPIPPTQPSPADFDSSLPRAQTLGPSARAALAAAREEASRLGHDYIGTEHVLLGVLKLAKGTFEEFLGRLHLDRETVRVEIERAVLPVSAQTDRVMVPLTPRARKALQFAAKEAKKLNQTSIGTEHIFLGLLLENGGIAGKVLRKLGICTNRAREEIVSKLPAHPSC